MTENKIKVSYVEKEEYCKDGGNANINIGVFTTSQARLMLYNSLQKLKDHQIVYMDTDSIYYVYKPNDENYVDLEMSDELGGLTDDLEGWIGEEWVSTGPKSYSLKMYKWKTNEKGEKYKVYKHKTKLKGFTLDIENSKKINHDSIKRMVFERENNPTIQIKESRIKKHNDRKLENIYQQKQMNFVYDKRKITPINDTHISTTPII